MTRSAQGLPSVSCLVLAGLLSLGGCTGGTDSAADPAAERRVDLVSHPSGARPGERATVLVFVAPDCPISNVYAPELRRLWSRYGARGVAFYRVYPESGLALSEAEAHGRAYELPMPAIRDPYHELVRATGVQVTPEAVVLDGEGVLRYRGRIDDLYVDFGKRREAASRRELRDALEAVLRGEEAPRATAPAVGCFIPELDPGPPSTTVPGEEAAGFGPELAELIASRCAGCHREGGSAPFPLGDVDEVARRARQIRVVTESRFMPPWKPEPEAGHGGFLGERRLTDAELRRLHAWIDAGAPREGAAPIRAPDVPGDWELGPPDLVLSMPEPFGVAAEGTDQFRNFVWPTGLDSERFVEAVEIRADNLRVTHHAVLHVNRDGSARAADEASAEPGYPGMSLALEPDHGGMDGWIPGMTTRALPPGLAWRLPVGADVVLETHFRPTGRPEQARFDIGLHFAPTPPRSELALVRLAVGALNIPAGTREYAVTDAFELPVDATVVAITPHAHRICREIRVEAVRPDGERVPLIWIRDWDFDWQDVYRFREPVSLPRGTRLEARLVYDNSAGNPRNPSSPPRRVLGGTDTRDEMAFVWLQAALAGRSDAEVLAAAQQVHTDAKTADYRLEALWGALVEMVDDDGDGSLDAGEERDAAAFLETLWEQDSLLTNAFDSDQSGALDADERAAVERFIAGWER